MPSACTCFRLRSLTRRVTRLYDQVLAPSGTDWSRSCCMRFERRQWWIIAAAALVFALVCGVRQSQALFISPLNSATGLGIASISLAFAAAQLMWGITQPFAGALADRYGSGRVVALGAVLVMLGTVLTPHAHSTWMLILLIGVVAAGGAGMA